MTTNNNKYPIGYYALQDIFARKVSEICDVPLKKAYEENTRFYILLATAYKEDVEIAWEKLISKIVEINDDKKRIKTIYNEINGVTERPLKKDYIGCFRYDYLKENNTASLHFSNKERSGESPLSAKNRDKRTAELKELFRRLKNEPYGENVNFRVYSWLNNFEPFSRLFPKELFRNALIKDYYRSSAVWGQFLDRNTNLRKDLIEEMLQNIQDATTCDELYASFPFKATEAIVPADVLYKHFGLK